MQERLKLVGVPTAVHYPIPLNRQPAVSDAYAILPVGDTVATRVMSLPMHPYLDHSSQQRIISTFLAVQ
ncbi:UDP-2-acetamido-2-deoxy-3-oxo-D-glucuronate aminotransferase [compost metagenome]